MKDELPRVVVERVLPASPAEVFRAWTEAESLRVFMCPNDVESADAEVDVRVGGRFRIVMHDAGRAVVHTGEYRVVEPPHRLIFTLHSPVTGPGGSVVTIELAPHADGTRLVLTHERLPADVADRHRRGWTTILEKLERQVASRAGGDLRLTYEYPVSADRLYAELATRDGIRHWWTAHCEMNPVVGGRAAFRFPNDGFYAVVRIVTLDPPRCVEWAVVGSRHPEAAGYADLQDWIGTRIRFEIEAVGATLSRLRFTHVGLAPLECATTCTSAWSFFLGTSLREYLTTGKGQPTANGAPSPSHFTYRDHFAAAPSAAYAAVATAAGVRSWWTTDCDVDERVGGKATFRFGETFNGMEIAALVPDREVRWRCVAQRHLAPGQIERSDEWVGTTLVFRFAAGAGGGTDFSFEHEGLAPALSCYALCENGWRRWLGSSLKRYLETGRGHPFGATAG